MSIGSGVMPSSHRCPNPGPYKQFLLRSYVTTYNFLSSLDNPLVHFVSTVIIFCSLTFIFIQQHVWPFISLSQNSSISELLSARKYKLLKSNFWRRRENWKIIKNHCSKINTWPALNRTQQSFYCCSKIQTSSFKN